MRKLTFILATVLTCYCSAGILAETVWHDSEQANRALCRFLLCTNELLEQRGQQELMGTDRDSAERSIAEFRSLLQRDAQNPYHWGDLGEAYLDAGQTENACYCFSRVLSLAPQSAALLLRAANFYLQIGDSRHALPITARILGLIPDYDSVIFSEYVRLVGDVDEVLQYGFPEGGRAPRSWLRFLMEGGRRDDAQRSWQWIGERGHTDDALAGEYAAFMIRQGRPDVAASAWAQYLGARSGDYRRSNYLFNGDFESEPIASPFDWNVPRMQGVEVARDCTDVPSGKCSLRLSFAGTQNLDFAAASQVTFVRPGRYRFHAFIRTDGLTTDQGLRFRVADAESPSRLDVVFGQFIGTKPWSKVGYDFLVPPTTQLLRVQVIRQASLRFDNKVAGTAWIRELRLEPISVPSPL
jgi:hypothetical protein